MNNRQVYPTFNAALLDNDIPAMKFAIETLLYNKVRFQRTSDHQLKIGRFNYYPRRGAITEDGNPGLEERGFERFVELCGYAIVPEPPSAGEQKGRSVVPSSLKRRQVGRRPTA